MVHVFDKIGKYGGKYGLPLSSVALVGALALTVYYSNLVKGLGFTEMFTGGDKFAQAFAITTCILIGLLVLSLASYLAKKQDIKNSKDSETKKVTQIPERAYGFGAFALTASVIGSFVYAMVAKFDKGQDFTNIFTQDKVMLGLLTTMVAAVVVLLLSEVLGRVMNDKTEKVLDTQGQDININTSPASVLHDQLATRIGKGHSKTN